MIKTIADESICQMIIIDIYGRYTDLKILSDRHWNSLLFQWTLKLGATKYEIMKHILSNMENNEMNRNVPIPKQVS